MRTEDIKQLQNFLFSARFNVIMAMHCQERKRSCFDVQDIFIGVLKKSRHDLTSAVDLLENILLKKPLKQTKNTMPMHCNPLPALYAVYRVQ